MNPFPTARVVIIRLLKAEAVWSVIFLSYWYFNIVMASRTKDFSQYKAALFFLPTEYLSTSITVFFLVMTYSIVLHTRRANKL